MLQRASKFWYAGNFASGTLLAQISAAATTMTLGSGQGALFPAKGANDPEYMIVLSEAEIVKVTLRVGDVFTIVRAQEGTTAQIHLINATCRLNVTAQMYNDLRLRCSRNERILALVAGGGRDGVKSNQGDTYLKVSQQSVANMTVKVAVGFGFISGEPVELESETSTSTLVAPVAHPRIDLVQFTLGTGINVKAGSENVSPTAPTVDADSIELARLAMTVGMTSIVTAGITDWRVLI